MKQEETLYERDLCKKRVGDEKKVTPLGLLVFCHDTLSFKETECECVQFIILWVQNLFTSSHVETRLPYGNKNPAPAIATIYFKVKVRF